MSSISGYCPPLESPARLSKRREKSRTARILPQRKSCFLVILRMLLFPSRWNRLLFLFFHTKADHGLHLLIRQGWCIGMVFLHMFLSLFHESGHCNIVVFCLDSHGLIAQRAFHGILHWFTPFLLSFSSCHYINDFNFPNQGKRKQGFLYFFHFQGKIGNFFTLKCVYIYGKHETRRMK